MSNAKDREDKSNQHDTHCAEELICSQCGDRYILRHNDEIPSSPKSYPSMCYTCRRIERERREKEKEERENQLWHQRKAEEYEEYLRQLPRWNVVPIDSIQPQADQVLYIIGNGFGLMHRVPSSYYSFRDSLGKNSSLRFALESFWTPDDIWADFENALAKFNAKAMSSAFMVDNYLDLYDVYDEDSGAAEFYMAAEEAANPIVTVAEELPRRFRMWVNTLGVGTDDRPLQSLFRKGKVLCFNYTEFVKSLYGIPEDRVCYIHGCRRKKKNKPAEELILGHQPGASDSALNYEDEIPKRIKQPYKRYLIESAQETALQIISDHDDLLTKHSSEIIAKHHEFFDGLSEINEIVVIGHSLSQVDWDYFEAVGSGLKDKNAVHWYFGCHGLRDMHNIEKLIGHLELSRSMVSIFRTDTIRVTPNMTSNTTQVSSVVKQAPKVSKKYSNDQQWMAEYSGGKLKLSNCCLSTIDYETSIPDTIRKVHFTPSGEQLLVIVHGYESGVLLFGCEDDHWHFVDKLKGIPNQGIINRRLNRAVLKDYEITFVYNSRVRVYDLRDGSLIKNQAVRNAKMLTYDGLDVSSWFVLRK